MCTCGCWTLQLSQRSIWDLEGVDSGAVGIVCEVVEASVYVCICMLCGCEDLYQPASTWVTTYAMGECEDTHVCVRSWVLWKCLSGCACTLCIRASKWFVRVCFLFSFSSCCHLLTLTSSHECILKQIESGNSSCPMCKARLSTENLVPNFACTAQHCCRDEHIPERTNRKFLQT